MKPWFRSLVAVCGLTLLSSATGLAQSRPAPGDYSPSQLQRRDPAVMTLHANSRAVLVDVVVIDSKGHAVKGLQAKDFDVKEDGQDQKIASVEEHHPATDAERAKLPQAPKLGLNTFTNRKPPPDGDTSIVLLIDSLDTPIAAQMAVRLNLLSYISSLKRGPEVAIFQLNQHLQLIQGFTSDPELLRTAVKRREKSLFPTGPGGRGYDAQAFRMDNLTSGLEALGAYLKNRPGRKSLVWFTARIPQAAYGGGLESDGTSLDGESFMFDYTKSTDALVLGQVTVYPVDARGLRANPAYNADQSGPPSGQQISNFAMANFQEHFDLAQVAEATGGKAFYDNNDIKGIVAQVVETGSNFYTLLYYPSNKVWDGTFRKLKVGVDQPDRQLRYRPGYYAQMESSLVRPTPTLKSVQQVDAAGRRRITHPVNPDQFAQTMQLGAVDPAEILFKTRVQPDPTVEKLGKQQPLPKDNYLSEQYRGKPFRNLRVTYSVEGGELQLTAQPDGFYQGNVELVTLVFDDAGVLVNSLKTSLDMTLKQSTYKRSIGGGFQIPVTIAVPTKGDYFLRMGIHDVAAGKAGALEVSLGDIQMGAVSP